MEKELIIPLPNGGTLRCGPGEDNEWGGYLRICDKDGIEIVYWDKQEWQDEGEEVIGAVFACALLPIKDMLSKLKRTKVVGDHWE
jgi:hypothetical protein